MYLINCEFIYAALSIYHMQSNIRYLNVRAEINAAFLKPPHSVRPGLSLRAITSASSEVRVARPRPDRMHVLILILNWQFRITWEEGHLRSTWPRPCLWRIILTEEGGSTHCGLNYSLSKKSWTVEEERKGGVWWTVQSDLDNFVVLHLKHKIECSVGRDGLEVKGSCYSSREPRFTL